MTGPTTAAELVALAGADLDDLHRQATSPIEVRAANDLAAAWPAFQHSGQRLLAVLFDREREPAPRPPKPAPGETPDAGLRRAADYLGAAADLLHTRDRRALTDAQRAADAADVRPHLTAAGYLVTATTATHPALIGTTAAAAAAVTSWQLPPATTGATATTGTVTSLVDAATVASAPAPHADDTSAPLTALHSALRSWQQTAAAATRSPAPSSSDLLGAARTAGMLTRLAQQLLSAHAGSAVLAEAAAVVDEQLQRAGAAWNAAADVWRTTATGGPTMTHDVRQAGADLEAAVRTLARSGPHWTSPQDLRTRTTAQAALQLARTALAAAQSVADNHAPLIALLGQTAALYTPARHLPVLEGIKEPPERVTARLDGQFVRLNAADSAPAVATYQRLPAAAAAARTALTALTSPAPVRHAATDRAATGHETTRTAQPAAQQQSPPEPLPATLAGRRWQQALSDVDPRLPGDPHYPALAAALDRIHLAGADVTATLAAAAARPLPEEHTARALHYQLIDVCPDAVAPLAYPPPPARQPEVRQRSTPIPTDAGSTRNRRTHLVFRRRVQRRVPAVHSPRARDACPGGGRRAPGPEPEAAMDTPRPVTAGPDRRPPAERPAPAQAEQTPPTPHGPTASAPDPWQSADGGYTVTDTGSGVTVDSLQVWRDERAHSGTFVRADVADVYGSAGPSYVGRPGANRLSPTWSSPTTPAEPWP